MVKRVFGSYATEEEAVKAVKELQEKGYKAEDLLLLGNRDTQEVLEEKTDVEIKTSPISNGNGDSLIDKIKLVFTQETGRKDVEKTKDKLAESGLSEKQAARYAEDVENGMVLIAADEESSGSTIRPLTDPNLDPIANAEESDNVSGFHEPTDDIPRNSENEVQPSSEDPEPSLESTHPAKDNKL